MRVSYTDGGGTRENVSSAPTASVTNANDLPTGRVVPSGTSTQGQTLTADTSGLSDEDGLGSFSYQWLRGGVAIAGATSVSYVLTQDDVGRSIQVRVSYTDGLGTRENVTSTGTSSVENINDPVQGSPVITGAPNPGEELGVNTSNLSDLDGLGATLFYEWFRDGDFIPRQRSSTYTATTTDDGSEITVRVYYTDGGGTVESVTSAAVEIMASGITRIGTAAADRLEGTDGADSLTGMAGNDTLIGQGDSDTLNGGQGADVLIGGDGDDFLFGGAATTDLRDVVYGGTGNDSIDGGYGNDELRGDAGNDTILGSYGADTVIGGDGNDALTGQAFGDDIFGGAGNDFINGGFGHDRVNGGTGADRFYHLGVFNHGADWIQDYNAAEGDVLQFGSAATAADFQVNYTETPNAGTAGVQEAFIIYRPEGRIIWALVDGQAQSSINLILGADTFDLLA